MTKKEKKLCCAVNPYCKGKCKTCCIRTRRSYQVFKDLAAALPAVVTKAEALAMVWTELDKRHSFRSRQNASYAKESLDVLIEDEDLRRPSKK